MAYQALYRRYRPRRFSEIRGQQHVAKALRNSVREGRVSHAYLFSGPRGTGKTSTARILAAALNCENLQDGEPCGVCESCVAIESGTSYDLQELDAASNNGVDAMRDLIAKAALGSPGRTKVYILDEVHMLSTAASNALLKTLEEPPAHVVFVLATTDPHKVLPTIRSRTQHFEFNLLPADELAEHVRWIVRDAGLDVDDETIDHVLRVGGGSARDTLSALDQVVAAGGLVDRGGDSVDELVEAICEHDTGIALRAVDDAVKSGRDPRVLGEALLARLRDVFLQRMGATVDHLPAADKERVADFAGRLGDRAVTRALEEVGDALLEMRQAPDVRIPLEVALVRVTRADADDSIDALVVRIEQLERALEAGRPGATGASGGGSSASQAADPEPSAGPPPPSPSRSRPADAARAALPETRKSAKGPEGFEEPPSSPPSAAAMRPPPSSTTTAPDQEALTTAWTAAVLPGLRGLARAMYSSGRFLPSDGGAAVFALDNEVHRARCEERRAEVEAALAGHFGRQIPLRLVIDPGAAGSSGGGSRKGDNAPQGGTDNRAPEPLDEAHTSAIDIAELEDAPPDRRTAFERLSEVFPGAERVEGE